VAIWKGGDERLVEDSRLVAPAHNAHVLGVDVVDAATNVATSLLEQLVPFLVRCNLA